MKIRNGFVSNSSSSSFVLNMTESNGVFDVTGHGSVQGTMGIGFTAKLKMPQEDIDKGIEAEGHNVFFTTYDLEETQHHSFVRPFTQMLDTQTLMQFREHTKLLFKTLYKGQVTQVKGPFIMACGYISND